MFQAYVTICDLLIIFSRQLTSNNVLASLVYEPDRGLQHLLNHFIQTYVFIDDEDGKFTILFILIKLFFA